MPNYLTYPFKTMRITQSYTGQTSHYPHAVGNPKDYPTDEGGKDGGRDWVYCDCDELVVKRIYGIGNSGVNTMWVESTSKVIFADGVVDYATLMLTHPNDNDLGRLHVGQKFKRGDKMCQEGTDGASGNHIHLSVGVGKMTGNGWTKNSKGKYVLTTTGGSIKPEQAFFIDPNFTSILDKKGLKFKELPKVELKPGEYVVTALALNVRAGTTEDSRIKDVLHKDEKVKVDHVKIGWNGDYFGKVIGLGWVDLRYCKKVK